MMLFPAALLLVAGQIAVAPLPLPLPLPLPSPRPMVQQQSDTTFAVPAGARLQLEVFNGSATVRTWDRAAMRVVATYSSPAELRVRQRNGVVSVEAERRGSFTGALGIRVRYEITVPRATPVSVEGMNVDVRVEGLQSNVSVENVEGAITVSGVTGNIGITSVSGAVNIDNVRGNVRVETVNQSLRLTDVRGNINVETVNGGIHMQRVDSRSVQASTVNGAIDYAGTIADGGRYVLGAHNGRITVAVPENTNATMAITTRMGQVDSAFPVRVSSTRDGHISLTLGSGSARVELESFNGTVRLVRP
jgi:DUF4097 and DUF4098 domain-containing protein YvlB